MPAAWVWGRRLFSGVVFVIAAACPKESLLAQTPGDFGRPAGKPRIELARPLLGIDGPHVLVHLTTNRVYMVEGTEVLWSAPAGTGTGFRLSGAGQAWDFATPKGIFRIRRKEKDPVWIAPDWYFVERGRNVPPQGDPSRRMPGQMGNTAIYLGDGIAIHGTSRPELLLVDDPEERRVSHGCIRLTNEAARELYHMVDVGMPVLIY